MRKLGEGVCLLVVIVLAIVFFVVDPQKQSFFPKCPFHFITGLYCPGCGSQRALHCLLHLDFAGTVRYNLLFLPAALFILYHYSHKLMNRLFNWRLPDLFYKKSTPWVVLVIVIVFFVIRNLPWYPFSILAPQ